MIQSMTGYGKAEARIAAGKLTVEIRTLNGKSADINIKTSLLPKDKDIPVRQKLAAGLQRGTIDFFLTLEADGDAAAKPIDTALAKAYALQIMYSNDQSGVTDYCGGASLSTCQSYADAYGSSSFTVYKIEKYDGTTCGGSSDSDDTL